MGQRFPSSMFTSKKCNMEKQMQGHFVNGPQKSGTHSLAVHTLEFVIVSLLSGVSCVPASCVLIWLVSCHY